MHHPSVRIAHTMTFVIPVDPTTYCTTSGRSTTELTLAHKIIKKSDLNFDALWVEVSSMIL